MLAVLLVNMSENIRATIEDLVKLYGGYESLAREIGVSWVTVHRWVKGRTNPSPLAARRIQELISRIHTEDS